MCVHIASVDVWLKKSEDSKCNGGRSNNKNNSNSNDSKTMRTRTGKSLMSQAKKINNSNYFRTNYLFAPARLCSLPDGYDEDSSDAYTVCIGGFSRSMVTLTNRIAEKTATN